MNGKRIGEVVLSSLGYVFLTMISLISLVPFLWTLLSSFKTNREILSSAFSLPQVFSFSNYVQVITKTPIVRYYGNSIVIAVISTLLGLLIFSMAAYVLARFSFRGKQLLFNLLSLSILVPITAIIFPVYITISSFGLYNTKTGLILVHSALSLPITLFIMRSYYLTIPKEIEEAARIDGSHFVRTFFEIIVPISLPGMSAASVLAFLTSWNDFLYALVLTSGEQARTVPIAIRFFQSEFGTNYGQLFASIILIILPSIIIYIALQKRIEQGLISGAVKG